MKAEIDILKKARETADAELAQLSKKVEEIAKERLHLLEEKEHEMKEKEELRKQKHVGDDQLKTLINLMENANKERDDLADELKELRERLASIDKRRALKLRYSPCWSSGCVHKWADKILQAKAGQIP